MLNRRLAGAALIVMCAVAPTRPLQAQVVDSALVVQKLMSGTCAAAWNYHDEAREVAYPPYPELKLYSSLAWPSPGPDLPWLGFYKNTSTHPIDPFSNSISKVKPIPGGERACIAFASSVGGAGTLAVFVHENQPFHSLAFTHALFCPSPKEIGVERPPRYEKVPDHCETGGRASYRADKEVVVILFEQDGGAWRVWVPNARKTEVEEAAITAVRTALTTEGTWFPCAAAGCCRAF